MKELLKDKNSNKTLITYISKIGMYICYYLIGISSLIFINGIFTRKKLILLIISVTILLVIRNILEKLYNNNSGDAYYSIKHSIELSYFKKLDKLSTRKLMNIDLNNLGNRILEVSYNITKMYNDIFEYLIPCAIGLIIFFITLAKIDILISILILIMIILIVHLEYKNNKESVENTNYNDLLIDFVSKLVTIRKLNIFPFCYKKLMHNKDNDICITSNNHTTYNKYYDIGIIIVISLTILSTLLLVRHSITILGYIIFYIIILYILKNLLYEISPSIKNIINLQKNKQNLDKYYTNLVDNKCLSNFNKISFKECTYVYEDSGLKIKLPEFQIKKKDHISILGKNGQGKTTLLNILSGIYKLESGTMSIDNGVSDVKIGSIYISRTTEIFNLTLRDNILLGNKIDDNKLLDLINEIGLTKWYKTLPDGLDTLLGKHNIEVNNKEREKINILRVIVSNFNLVLLDEPTYDLNIEDENVIAEMLKKYLKDKTMIIVTHRPILSNICDIHYFMKDHELQLSETLL